jgi:hypothetical protein
MRALASQPALGQPKLEAANRAVVVSRETCGSLTPLVHQP